jgi:hypothetical protein
MAPSLARWRRGAAGPRAGLAVVPVEGDAQERLDFFTLRFDVGQPPIEDMEGRQE